MSSPASVPTISPPSRTSASRRTKPALSPLVSAQGEVPKALKPRGPARARGSRPRRRQGRCPQLNGAVDHERYQSASLRWVSPARSLVLVRVSMAWRASAPASAAWWPRRWRG